MTIMNDKNNEFHQLQGDEGGGLRLNYQIGLVYY